MLPAEALLNYAAQGHIAPERAWQWFADLPQETQLSVLTDLWQYIQQAHPAAELVQQAVSTAPLKPTATPLILLRVRALPQALRAITRLPATEYRPAFRALLHLFTHADTARRRTACQGTCTHAWHHLPALPPSEFGKAD